MKNLIIASCVAAFCLSFPALAGTVADPVVDPEVVAQAAVDDSMGDIDALLVAIGYILFLLVAGGAF